MEQYKKYLENIGLTDEQKNYIQNLIDVVHTTSIQEGKIAGMQEAIKVVSK